MLNNMGKGDLAGPPSCYIGTSDALTLACILTGLMSPTCPVASQCVSSAHLQPSLLRLAGAPAAQGEAIAGSANVHQHRLRDDP